MLAFRAGLGAAVGATALVVACTSQGPAPLTEADKVAMQQVADGALEILNIGHTGLDRLRHRLVCRGCDRDAPERSSHQGARRDRWQKARSGGTSEQLTVYI